MKTTTRKKSHFRVTALAQGVQLTLAGLTLFTCGAYAADPPEPPHEQAGKAESTLPQVTVSAAQASATTEGTGSYTTESMNTGTPFGLSIRETPQSVSVVTRERIDDQALTSITDVVNNVTGVTAREYDSSRQSFAARGFDITNLQIDGIPTTWDAGWSAGETQTDTLIYDRVEVVRGATGLMTGAGEPSAAINLVRKRATSKDFTGNATLGLGSWQQYRGSVDLSSGLNASGSVRGRVVAGYEKQNDSYVDLQKNERKVLYGVVDADLTRNTVLSVGASYQDNDPKGSTWGGLPIWFSDGTRTDWGRSKTTAANWSAWSSRETAYFANLEHTFDSGWKVRGGAAQRRNEADLKLLYLYGSPDPVTGQGMSVLPSSHYVVDQRQNDVYLQATGPFSLLGRKHELSVGAVYSHQNLDVDYGAAMPDSGDVGNFFRWDGSYPMPSYAAGRPSDRQVIKQLGIYMAGRFSLTDASKLIVGGRFTKYTKSIGQTDFYEAEKLSETAFTPYVGFVYDINRNHSFYLSYTDIFNPQTERDRNGNFLDPLVGKSYEAGLKSEYFGGDLNTQLTVFRIKQDNLAQPDGNNLVPGTINQAYYAAQGATSTGFEIDVSGRITPGWNVSAGFTHFSAHDATGQDVNTRHPRTILRLFTSYRPSGDWNKLMVGGGVNWEAVSYMMVTNPLGAEERVQQGAYALVSLMARYDFNKHLSAQLNINNLFDKKYYSQIGFYSQLAYGAPRNALLTLKYRF